MIYWLGEGWEYGFGGAYIDYNDDWIRDIVGYRNNYDNLIDMPEDYTGYERKQPIRFFLGDCEGNFVNIDTNNWVIIFNWIYLFWKLIHFSF